MNFYLQVRTVHVSMLSQQLSLRLTNQALSHERMGEWMYRSHDSLDGELTFRKANAYTQDNINTE
jgi:hypothetical protein